MYNDLLDELSTAFDPLVDSILSPLAKLSGATKKITAENSQNTVSLIIKKTTCPPKTFIPFLSLGVHEKAPQVRGYYARHLKEYIEKHNANRGQAWSGEHIGGVIEMLKHLLGDSTPSVRETARQAFWALNIRYSNEATNLLNNLDDGARKQLERVKPAPVSAVVEPFIPATTNVSAPTAIKERKPVSSMMAEMKRKKMAAMRALAASRSSNEDLLLPETDSNSTAPSSPLRPDSTPPVQNTPAGEEPISAPVTGTRSPAKPSRVSLSRHDTPPRAQPKQSPAVPAHVPLPESPVLIDLESRRNRQSSRVVSPPRPAPNPFEDVFTSPTPPPAASIDAIQAELASLRFAVVDTSSTSFPNFTDRSSPPSQTDITVLDTPPILPLALTVPEAIQTEEVIASESEEHVGEHLPGGVTESIKTPATTVNPIDNPGTTDWNPAAQSYRTPPFADCATWLEAVRAEEMLDFDQERNEAALALHRNAKSTGTVTADYVTEVFRGLVHIAHGRNRSASDITDVDGIRRLFDREDALRHTAGVEEAVADLIEVVNQQLNRKQVSSRLRVIVRDCY